MKGVQKRALEVLTGILCTIGLFYASYALGNCLAPLRSTEGMELIQILGISFLQIMISVVALSGVGLVLALLVWGIYEAYQYIRYGEGEQS